MFTILSLRINPFSTSLNKITFDHLSNSVLVSAHKKDKICTIGEKFMYLLPNLMIQ